MLVPAPVLGTKNTIGDYPQYHWLKDLPNKKIFLALFQNWDSGDLPIGYDFYIVSFHLEVVSLAWLTAQSKLVSGKIIVLSDGSSYDYQLDNVTFLPFFYWHEQLATMISWHGTHYQKNITNRFSCVCNRITQSKLLAFTAIAEYSGLGNKLILHSWYEDKNVHGFSKTGNGVIDNLTDIFQQKYLGKDFSLDDFTNDLNFQRFTSNPSSVLYQNAALHFTNESFHYSYMVDNGKSYIHPGPFITEKTLKCLLGKTGFVPVGQFDTYGALRQLGFRFDYKFNTAWDADPGNLSRLESVIALIKYLSDYSANDLYEMTVDSTDYNFDHVVSGQFYQQCNAINEQTLDQIFRIIS